ncbi:Outer membrane protein beta-barrel domain-containing protein [Pedobacter westerhofensis]|uniref:Outer membrane protein beta-barrel domain-containing protein n=1 Tax=Pedobacter westerhofensis TaxID=425512 RepID=A0A521FR23_9SPHI|nr:porin family protein [Pedobacter westerhofensis]SMO97911.1 Outer membrane protein beta-barrel domain-containing protein [Pedobacter westerhofensis]
MKKLLLSALFICFSVIAFGQVLPSFQFGIKGGTNLSKLTTDNTLGSDNRSGYYAGVWARIGAAGIHFQPELYLAGKNTTLTNDAGFENKVRFTSLDVPLLIGTKIGAAGVGLRLNTGPVVSFILDDKQSFGNAAGSVFKGNFKNQAVAWQFGAGFDFGKLGLDLRYEAGLSKIGKSGYDDTKLNLFTLGLALRLF